MTIKFTLLILAVLCTTSYAQLNSDEAAIRAARLSSNRAIQLRDIAAFAKTLDTDFVAVRGNGALVPSRQAYVDLFTQDFANTKGVSYERVPDTVEISNAAPLAAEHGHWMGTRPNGHRAYEGTYLAMWRKTEAGWRIRSELFVVLVCDDNAACAGYRKP